MEVVLSLVLPYEIEISEKLGATYYYTRWVPRRYRTMSRAVLSQAPHLNTWMVAGYSDAWILTQKLCELDFAVYVV